MKITMSGDPGAGKSTVAKILAKKLGLKRYYIGGIRREMAAKRGLSLEEYNLLGETDSSTDIEVDNYQKKLGKKEDNIIIEGRTSYFLIPDSLKVYLKVSLDEGAKRIINHMKTKEGAKRNETKEKHELSIEEMKEKLINRKKSDVFRYKKYYDQDVFDLSHYDLVIDTTNISVEQVVNKLLDKIMKNKK